MLRGNPDSCVADRNLYGVVVHPCPDLDFAPLRYGLGRIYQYVHEDLVQLVWKALHFGDITEFFDNMNSILQLMAEEDQSAFYAFVNVDPFPFSFIQPGEILEPMYEVY